MSGDLESAKIDFSEHALAWLRLTVQDSNEEWYGNEWVRGAPVLMRLSDRAVLCSTADVIPEALDAYKELVMRTRRIEESGVSHVEYDTGLRGVVAKMMGQVVDIPQEVVNPVSYAIVRDTYCGELEVCGPNRFVLCNTLEGQRREYKELALKWAKLAVKGEEGMEKPPILMRLTDGAVLCSVKDFLSEMQEFHDGFMAKCEAVKEELRLLKQDFDARLERLIRGLVASV